MTDKVIWITGASSGIGKALAIKFANEGWKVAISARRENLLNEISKKYRWHFPYPLDVTDSENANRYLMILKKNLKILIFQFLVLEYMIQNQKNH